MKLIITAITEGGQSADREIFVRDDVYDPPGDGQDFGRSACASLRWSWSSRWRRTDDAVTHWPRWTLYAVTSGSAMVVLSIAAWSAAWVVVA